MDCPDYAVRTTTLLHALQNRLVNFDSWYTTKVKEMTDFTRGDMAKRQPGKEAAWQRGSLAKRQPVLFSAFSPVFFLRRKSIVQYLGCSNWMVRITGFSNKSCSAFACCNRVRYIVPLKKTMLFPLTEKRTCKITLAFITETSLHATHLRRHKNPFATPWRS